ncbi:MAG: DUF4175 family protein [Albidovulum sp.]|nr:DUF4175 family protein [Albidovulum sp.]
MPASIFRNEFNSGDALNRIKNKIRITWYGILAERLALALWQPLTLVLFLGAGSSLGLHAVLPEIAILAISALALAGFGFLLVRGFSKFRWPARGDAIRRLDSSVPEYPITAVCDNPAIGLQDLGTVTVWREHQAQMAAVLKTVSPIFPKTEIYKEDRFALRYIGLTAFIAGTVFGPVLGSPKNSSSVGGAASAQASNLVEAWVQPPSYTRKPPLYLSAIDSEEALSVPEASLAIVRFYGESDQFSIEQSVSDSDPVAQAPGSAYEIPILRSGEILVGFDSGDGNVGRWSFNVVQDSPPKIELTGELVSDASGKLTVPLKLTDDYGVESARVELGVDIDRIDRRFGLATEPALINPEILDIPLPFSGSRSALDVEFQEYFDTNRLSGLAVNASFFAIDDAGQESNRIELSFELPKRQFSEALAASFAELRRDLLWSGENSKRVAQVTRALSHRPAGFIDDGSVYLMARSAVHILESGMRREDNSGQKSREAADILWAAALVQEDGDLSMARKIMRELAKRLERAIRQGLSEAEIAKLWEEYQEATDNFLQELAKRSAEYSGGYENLQNSVREAPIEEMLNRLDSLIRNGRLEEAADVLSSIQEIMDGVAEVRPQGEGRRSELERSVEELRDTLDRQQDLTDDSFRMLRRGQMERGAMAGPADADDAQLGNQGKSIAEGGQELGELANRQTELKNRLGDQVGNIPVPGDSGQLDAVQEIFRGAEQSMGLASEYIASGDLEGALDEQTDAMSALRQGIREIAESWQQASGSEAGPVPSESGMDPFGRTHSNAGLWANDDMLSSDGEARKRIEELRNEIRRRSGDTSRPPLELDYLKRLLKRF